MRPRRAPAVTCSGAGIDARAGARRRRPAPPRSPRRAARREHLPPSDRTIARLLLEAPALPHAGAAAFLADLAASGGEWATLALTAARGVAVARPPDRAMALGVVLAAAVGADADLRCAPCAPAAPLAGPRSRRRPRGAPRRTKAVRLVANKLFTEPAMAGDVERFAAAALRELADAARPAAGGAAPASNGVKREAGAAPGAGAGEDVGDGAGDGAAPGAGAAADEQRARQRCQLFCALCTKRHALLRTLFEVYGQVAPASAPARTRPPPLPAGRRPGVPEAARRAGGRSRAARGARGRAGPGAHGGRRRGRAARAACGPAARQRAAGAADAVRAHRCARSHTAGRGRVAAAAHARRGRRRAAACGPGGRPAGGGAVAAGAAGARVPGRGRRARRRALPAASAARAGAARGAGAAAAAAGPGAGGLPRRAAAHAHAARLRCAPRPLRCVAVLRGTAPATAPSIGAARAQGSHCCSRPPC